MSKREFLNDLEERLSILDEEEVKDILDEYENIIDEKVKSGKTVIEAVGEFGSIDELSEEILKAYKLNSKFTKKNKKPIKDFEEGIKRASKSSADFVSGLFKNHNFSIEFICEIVIKFLILLVLLALLRLPFELISNIGEVIFDMAFEPLDTILEFLFDIGVVILYFIVGAFIFIAIFKQYLNVEDFGTKKEKKRELKEKKTVKKEVVKEEKVKEPRNSEGTISKIFSNLYKLFMVFVFLIPLWLSVFGISVALCLIIYYAIMGINIWGLVIVLAGVLLGFSWLTSFFHSITFNTKRMHAFFIIVAIFTTLVGGIVFTNELMSF